MHFVSYIRYIQQQRDGPQKAEACHLTCYFRNFNCLTTGVLCHIARLFDLISIDVLMRKQNQASSFDYLTFCMLIVGSLTDTFVFISRQKQCLRRKSRLLDSA